MQQGSLGYNTINVHLNGDLPGGGAMAQVDVADSVASQEIAPNTLYKFASRSSNLALSLGTPQEGKANEYMFQITIDGTTLPTISGLPGTIVWNGGGAPAFALGKFYEVSILNGVGYFVEI